MGTPHRRVRDPTCSGGSETERRMGVGMTSGARDEATHLGGFKGSGQDDKKSRHLVNRRLPSPR